VNRAPGPAPLYTDAFALCEWLLGHFGDDPRLLPQNLCHNGLALLDAVTLALKGRRREEQIDAADEGLIRLRTQLRLAATAGYLTEAQSLHALERADAIGRQLGGWMRALGPV
jgi:hypothetical protein